MVINTTPIPTLRHGNLVYVRNLKCGSTFFYNNLLIAFGWEVINYDTINWQTDHVFGHLFDPIKRRHKGVAEFVDMCNLTDEFITDVNLQNLLSSTPFLDRHAVAYTDIFKEKSHQIDWIPLAYSNQENIKHTQALLNYHKLNVVDADWDFEYIHDSNQKKKQVEQILSRNWTNNISLTEPELTRSITSSEFSYFTNDINLYNLVVKNFNTSGNSWKEMSWLRNNNV